MLKNTLMIQIQVLLSTRITDRPELTKVKRLKMLLTTISPGTENNDEEEITMKKKYDFTQEEIIVREKYIKL